MAKRYFKHKLLFDENMPPRTEFTHLNEQFDVKHIDHDLKHGGATDHEVYEVAVAQRRIIVTQNVKHFRPLAGTQDDPGIIGVPNSWLPSKLDTRLTAFLKRRTPASLRAQYVSLGSEEALAA